MPLPSAYSTTTPVSLYPDKVTVNFQYDNTFSAPQLARGLFQYGLKRYNDSSWKGKLDIRAGDGRPELPYYLRVTRPGYRAPLNFYVDLNILTEVHAHAVHKGSETPTVPSATNWIPSHLVQPDNRFLWRLFDDLVLRALQRVTTLVNHIDSDTVRASREPPRCSHISVSSAEASLDLHTSNPREFVRRHSAAFGSLLRETEHREYATHSLRVIRPESDWMIHGFMAMDERVKLYAKTTRRVRFEYRFREAAFQRLKINRSLSDQRSFAQIFATCAAQSHMVFAAIRSRSPRIFNMDQQSTPIDFISNLVSCSRNSDTLRDLLDCLLRTGKVRSNVHGRGLVDRLRERGLLEPSLVRGFCCVPARHLRALQKLQLAQFYFFTNRFLRSDAEFKTWPAPGNGPRKTTYSAS